MTWSDSARDLRMENMMSCLRKDDTFSICKDSAKFSSSAGDLVFSSARCIIHSRRLSWVFSHWEFRCGRSKRPVCVPTTEYRPPALSGFWPRAASLFGWRAGDRNFPGLGLVARSGGPDLRFFSFLPHHLRRFFAVLVTRPVALRTALLTVHLTLVLLRGRLVHQVKHAEVVLRVLQIPLGHDPV